MTANQSKRGWQALMPIGNVRFKRTQGANHKTDEIDTPSYLGDHLHLTEAGEKFINLSYCGRYL